MNYTSSDIDGFFDEAEQYIAVLRQQGMGQEADEHSREFRAFHAEYTGPLQRGESQPVCTEDLSRRIVSLREKLRAEVLR
jgi:hypothetical protein